MPAASPDLTNAVWHKSSRSNPSGGDCVELAVNIPGWAPVRDSKSPDGTALLFSPASWSAFIGGVKGGVLARP
ncbi:DUF397 domain-containing protein [Streptomyces albidus (ex Kaewkla and Franco 2022)]|uniref:DUF397 domain-containing protein n=1 Tax=Streptomyces albidus (ex Kaewkla and Franco 2022) TaxID=722709 RepID=UPI0015EF729E|nr:DUF397 domain-containing protein [Streptomyces albidus (ex Kaewkla and Franco 2022)]